MTGYLVNVSAATLLNEEALINALKNGAIAGATLDVCARESILSWVPARALLKSYIGDATRDELSRTWCTQISPPSSTAGG
jgi:lactate dehydrogenase-like 2-hydroxyacid dehydrogenase